MCDTASRAACCQLGPSFCSAFGRPSLDDEVLSFHIPEVTQSIEQSAKGRRYIGKNAETIHFARLLRARRERPRNRGPAECGQQSPPSDGDCHTPLPCEVRKGDDTTPRACCP